MSRHREDDYEEVEEDEEIEEEEDEDYRRRTGGRKRGRSDFIDDAAIEDDDDDEYKDEEDEDEELYGGRGKKRRKRGSEFFDLEAQVDSDDEEEEDEEAEDDFINDAGTDLPDESGGRRAHRPLNMMPEDQVDVEEMERQVYERYAKSSHIEYGEDATEVEQQALLPSVKDSKLWMVKCDIGRERETAICLMQKFMDRPDLHIRSVVALDHLKNYIYVEADKEAHVKEACKGLRTIYSSAKLMLVPIKEMTDVLSVGSKTIEISRDTWVRMKLGIYKGDLAKVVDVDNVRQKVTVKLIPRIDLQYLANKLENRDVVKKKAFVPPPRFFNIDEAREMHIRVEHKRDKDTGEYFEMVENMMFKDGFLYKTVSMKSIRTQNIQPTFDELAKFHKPGGDDDDDGDVDMASLSTLISNRKRGHFMKGDAVAVVRGDLKNLKGWVEKAAEDIVHVKPEMDGLPKTLAFNERELCKHFELGDHVKVVLGVQEGATGMVVKVDGHVLIIASDTTKEDICVFADNVIKSFEVTRIVVGGDNSKHGGDRFDLRHSSSYLQSPRKPPRGPTDRGGRHNRGGGRENDALIGRSIRIRSGPFKGYRGRVAGVTGSSVCIELDSQMKIVAVKRDDISDTPGSATPFRETPMHPSGTPLRPYQTPMRDAGATPIYDGMRTAMRNRAWAYI